MPALSACLARRRRRPASILQTAASRRQTCRLCPGCHCRPRLLVARRPLIVGLTNDPERLIQLRRNRLDVLHHDHPTEYPDIDAVRAEVREARRVFVERNWPVIDVTRRSIEETAAAIMLS